MSNSAISCPQLSGALVPSRVCRSSTVARSLPDTIWKIECSVVKYVKNLGSVTSIVNYIETQWWTCMETWNYFIIPHHSFLLLYPHPHTCERVRFLCVYSYKQTQHAQSTRYTWRVTLTPLFLHSRASIRHTISVPALSVTESSLMHRCNSVRM